MAQLDHMGAAGERPAVRFPRGLDPRVQRDAYKAGYLGALDLIEALSPVWIDGLNAVIAL